MKVGWRWVEVDFKNIDIDLLVMVRLEKVLYEKVVNGMTRAKSIGSPRKWFHANPYEHLRRIPRNIQSIIITTLNITLSAKSWLRLPNSST